MKPRSLTTTTKPDPAHLTMESLALPQELYWDGKTEPTSPPSSELFSIVDSNGNWLNDDNFANGIKLFADDDLEMKPGLEFSDELINGEDLVIQLYDLKEVADWSDTKLQSGTTLLDFQIGAVVSHPNPITKVQNSFDLINFNTASFETAILTQLTPPHSPPQSQAVASPAFQTTPAGAGNHNHINNELLSQSTTPLSPQTPVHAVSNASSAVQNVHFSPWNNTHGSGALNANFSDDIARDVQIVDDIVNIRAKELLTWNDELESMSSSVCSQAESEDWSPDTSSSYSSSVSTASSSPAHASSEEALQGGKSAASTKKRPRPYGRGVEDRKIRKKEQNKNAATRYRQKKKIEMETVHTEEQQLVQRHEELQRLLTDSKREAKYLKTLIREFYQQKQK